MHYMDNDLVELLFRVQAVSRKNTKNNHHARKQAIAYANLPFIRIMVKFITIHQRARNFAIIFRMHTLHCSCLVRRLNGFA